MASTACRMATWFSVGEKSTRHSSPLAFQACLRQIALQDISVKRIIFHCYEISRTVAGKYPLGTPARFQGRSTRRSEEHKSELQSLMRHTYAVFCLNKKYIIPNLHSSSSHDH